MVTQPPDTGVGFSQLTHDIEVQENLGVGQLVHTVGLEQKPESSRGLNIDCKIMKVIDGSGRTVKGIQCDTCKINHVSLEYSTRTNGYINLELAVLVH